MFAESLSGIDFDAVDRSAIDDPLIETDDLSISIDDLSIVIGVCSGCDGPSIVVLLRLGAPVRLAFCRRSLALLYRFHNLQVLTPKERPNTRKNAQKLS